MALRIYNIDSIYDKVSDVVESGVGFASKILTPHRMHYNWLHIAHFNPMMHSFQMMYDILLAKVDRLAGKSS